MRAFACVPLAVALAGLAPPVTAASVPRQSASVVFTSRQPGTPTGVQWALDYRNPDDPAGKPHAVQETVAVFPAGTRFDFSAPAQCKASDAELTLTGPNACPAASRVGSGSLDVDTGSASPAVFPRIVHNDVTNFNNEHESIVFTQSTNSPGVPTRTVTRAKVSGTTVTTEVPPIPALPPPDPFLALRRFRLAVAPLTNARGSYVTTPGSCPASRRWAFTFTFVYRDGVREVVHSASPCVPASRPQLRPRLRLAVEPRRAVAGDATRFHFVVTRPGGAAAARAEVSLGDRRVRADRNGRATAVVRFARAGRYLARATLQGFRPAIGWVHCEADD